MATQKTEYKESKYITGLIENITARSVKEGFPRASADTCIKFIQDYCKDYHDNKPEQAEFDGVTFPFGKFRGEKIKHVAKYNDSYCNYLLSKSYVDEPVKDAIRKCMKAN